jgi:hypothetical protein
MLGVVACSGGSRSAGFYAEHTIALIKYPVLHRQSKHIEVM